MTWTDSIEVNEHLYQAKLKDLKLARESLRQAKDLVNEIARDIRRGEKDLEAYRQQLRKKQKEPYVNSSGNGGGSGQAEPGTIEGSTETI